MKQYLLFLVLGILFGAIAGLMAFLIIYSEYQKHRLEASRLWREALGGAAVAFAVFVILSLAAGYWSLHFIGRP